MSHRVIDPLFSELIDEYSPVRQLGTGFTFTEGPLWNPTGNYLLFSDMPGDVRRKWQNGNIDEVERPTNKANGLTYDADRNLLICEHSTSSIVRILGNGTREVLCSHFEGRELNSPNDIVVGKNGSIYFTDPTFGRMDHFGIKRPLEQGFQGVYRMEADHRPGQEPELVSERYMFSQPNGLCFSPCERWMWVNDTKQANIRMFDVADNGQLLNARIFASGIRESLREGVPDGMKADRNGNVYVTAPGGIWVYGFDGKKLGEISIPEEAANLHWGGADWNELFVCASTSLYSVKTLAQGRIEPFMITSRQNSTAQSGVTHGSTHGSTQGSTHRSTQGSTHGSTQGSTQGSITGASQSTAQSTDQAQVPAVDLEIKLVPASTALILQDLQNDVMIDGGAFASTGSPQHAREQNVVANAKALAEACRAAGITVIHVWMVCEPGHPKLTDKVPLFQGLKGENALVRGTWGVQAAAGLEAQADDLVVEKMSMSAWETSRLESYLRHGGIDTIINCGAWTNMSVEHTARTGADKGFRMIVPEDACSTMNAEWHKASIEFAMTNVAQITRTSDLLNQLRR